MDILDLVKEQFDNNKQTSNDEDLPWETPITEEKNKKKPNTKIITVIGISVLVFVVLGAWLFNYFGNASGISVEKNEEAGQIQEKKTAQIQVHVSGAVNKPGVYKLDEGSRVMDAVNAASGFTEKAVQDSLNLAKVVEDGEQIVVSSTDATGSGSLGSTSSGSTSGSNPSANGKVNINTADLTQLQTLSGVGPATAQKIIDYRTANGKFKNIEELKNVSGIGDKTFAKFADKICV